MSLPSCLQHNATVSMPSRLGRYAVRRRIGSGAFATVWLAYDEQLDSPVAIKVLADNWTEDHHVRQRFLEEGRYLRKVESPHVVSVYDAGELDDGQPYLVMAYADQGTLADRLEVQGLTVREALEVVSQVGAGLQALHARSILHRDVKPANVLFRTSDGRVRAMVGDLGLGKALDMSSRLTMIAGTPSFVAPEQARGEGLDARADLYSLAALSFLLLSGRAAYAHAALSAAAAPGEPPPLTTSERPFTSAVDAVVRRGLAPDRDARWPDVASYVAALAQALDLGPDPEGHGAMTRPWVALDPELTQAGAAPSPLPRRDSLPEPGRPAAPRRRRVVAATLVALALAGGAGTGYAVQRQLPSERTFSDDSGSLSVTVPRGWDLAVSPKGWLPPNDSDEFPAISAGEGSDWAEAGRGAHGVFVGILPGSKLPTQVPQHPECDHAEAPVEDTADGDPSVTVFYTACPGGVTVERVVRVTANRLLWVQVRSADRATANLVLDDVRTHGM